MERNMYSTLLPHYLRLCIAITVYLWPGPGTQVLPAYYDPHLNMYRYPVRTKFAG